MTVWLVSKVLVVVVGVLYAGFLGFALVRCEFWAVCGPPWTMVEGPDGWYWERVVPEVETVEYKALGFEPVLESEGETDGLGAVYQDRLLLGYAGIRESEGVQ